MRAFLGLFLASMALCLPLGSSRADTMYTYTSNPFTAFTPASASGAFNPPSISGDFVLSNPLAANLSDANILGSLLSFSFSDGNGTLTNNSIFGGETFLVSTDALGNITGWDIDLFNPSPDNLLAMQLAMLTESDHGTILDNGSVNTCEQVTAGHCSQTFLVLGSNSGDAGSWSVSEIVSQTPLPAALPLFATGLVGLGLIGWRRKRKARAVA